MHYEASSATNLPSITSMPEAALWTPDEVLTQVRLGDTGPDVLYEVVYAVRFRDAKQEPEEGHNAAVVRWSVALG